MENNNNFDDVEIGKKSFINAEVMDDRVRTVIYLTEDELFPVFYSMVTSIIMMFGNKIPVPTLKLKLVKELNDAFKAKNGSQK